MTCWKGNRTIKLTVGHFLLFLWVVSIPTFSDIPYAGLLSEWSGSQLGIIRIGLYNSMSNIAINPHYVFLFIRYWSFEQVIHLGYEVHLGELWWAWNSLHIMRYLMFISLTHFKIYLKVWWKCWEYRLYPEFPISLGNWESSLNSWNNIQLIRSAIC